jgi:homogentisate 1,2-dioxygenase
MFESSLSLALTKYAADESGCIEEDYNRCWQSLKKNFNPNWKPAK